MTWAFFLLFWAFADPHPKQGAAPLNVAVTPEAVEAGQKLFATACSGCHGQRGEGGRGPKLNSGDAIRAATDERLFSSITHGVKGTAMPPFSFTEVEVHNLIAFIRSLSSPAADSVVAGNADAGRAIFFGKGGCSGCHSVLGQGGLTGPDLSNEGADRSITELRQTLEHPEVRPDGEYQAARVTLRSGQTVEGVLRGATNYAYALQTASGELKLLGPEDIREIRLRKESLMPSYAGKLSAAEMSDVIAFLAKQTIRARERKQTAQAGESR